MAIDKKYLEEAKQMLSGGFENQKVQLNNSFNQNTQSLEGQKGGVNQNFDNQLEQNAMNTTRSKNQYNNNSIARGLGRSTIATSGQAGIQDSGNRIANSVEEQRTGALGNIEAQKTMLQQSLQESLLGLTAQQDSESLGLAQQLEEKAYGRQFEADQFNFTKEQTLADNTFREAQFNYGKAQDALDYAMEREKFGYTKEKDSAQMAFDKAQFEFSKAQTQWENAFKNKQFDWQKSQSGGSGGSGGSGSGSGGSGTGSNFNSTSAWKYFDQLLAKDNKNGTYEAGRFAQQVSGISPSDSAAMMKAYNETKKKTGSAPKQTTTNKNTGKTYSSY